MNPGIVRMGGKGIISLKRDKKLEPLIDLLAKARFEVEIVPDPEALIWGKLVINASINPLTALLRVPNGELVSNPSARRIMNLVTIKSAEVAEALKINLPYLDPVSAVEAVAPADGLEPLLYVQRYSEGKSNRNRCDKWRYCAGW